MANVTNPTVDIQGNTLLLKELIGQVLSGSLDITGSITGEDVQIGHVTRKSTTVLDAAIKTLPTTLVELVAAPGANLMIMIYAIMLQSKFTAGAYTNVNAAGRMLVGYGTGTAKTGSAIPNDVAITNVTVGTTILTGFLGAAARSIIMLPYANSEGLNSWGLIPSYFTTTDMVNKAVNLIVNNNAGGNFTGGNAANSMKVRVFYTIMDMS